MERFHMDFHGFDYQLHCDLEDELMGAELPCPGASSSPAALELQQEKEPPEDFPHFDDEDEPDDPDHAGFPEEDEGSCEDLCDIFPAQEDEDPEDIFQDEDTEDDGAPSDTEGQ